MEVFVRNITIFLWLALIGVLPIQAVESKQDVKTKIETSISKQGVLIKKRYNKITTISSGSSRIEIQNIQILGSNIPFSGVYIYATNEEKYASNSSSAYIDADELPAFLMALKKIRQDIEQDSNDSESYYKTSDGVKVGFIKDASGKITMVCTIGEIGSTTLYFPRLTDIFGKKPTEYFDLFIQAIETASTYEFK